jgi:murein L,D-transpeptidase YcbB/YkuD
MAAAKWNLPRKKLSYKDLLDSLLDAPSSEFMQKEPVYPQYQLLKKELQRYRLIAEKGGWPMIVTDQKSLKPGDSSAAIAVLKNRLFLSGDLTSVTTGNSFDAPLEAAVKQFQYRHGLAEDGVVGKQMMAALNIPVAKRIEQIIINLERCRWMPVSLGNNYLLINIPEYKFHAFENESLQWSMKVVVGKSIHETAVFSGLMTYIVFSPYWNIPPGILKNEILPAIRRNRNYLARNNMEWYANGVRQKPGPNNSLGLVKFMFPNSHNIYLHDTPAKHLFNQDSRAFSHGCIRVEQPKKLASYVLQHQPDWNEERIDSAMHAGKEQIVNLKEAIPVLIAYFTSWVDENGLLNFRSDIYKRDEQMTKIIFKTSKP